MISADRRSEIAARLAAMAAEEGVRVLYACESGSRAWGFPSADSDYDVRFIYAHPVEWYLSVQTRRDVIERPLDNLIDLSGWDVRKAMVLLRKSNPPLLEWLQSPIVYQEDADFLREMHALLPAYYSPRNCMHHYLHMAQGNIREYLKGDRVWVKKYFYVLRPLLACRWIEAGLGVVPMEFRKLVDGVSLNDDLRQAIERILVDKLAGREMDDGPRVPVFHEFFDQEMPRLESIAESVPAGPKPDHELLDHVFRRLVGWNRE
jgi:predicted nucleotidyltransferase